MRGPGARRRSGIRNEEQRPGLGPPATRAQRRGTRTSSAAPTPHRLVAGGHLRAEELPTVHTATADASPREKGPGGPTERLCLRWPWLLRARGLQPEKAHLDAACLRVRCPALLPL